MSTAAETATAAAEAVRRCHALAACSEEPGATTRTFLSAPMRDVHAHVTQWMTAAGMTVAVDHAGNIRGVYPLEIGQDKGNPTFTFYELDKDNVTKTPRTYVMYGVVTRPLK